MQQATAQEAERRFAADAMLGRLAKWLRMMGYDTLYDPRLGTGALITRALNEHRVLLTRNTRVADEYPACQWHLVRQEAPRLQVAEVIRAFNLDVAGAAFSRCVLCNAPLEALAREAVAAEGRVPPTVLQRHRFFRRCPECGRIYWVGTHVRNTLRRLQRWDQNVEWADA